jgi:8-oxo-dGTP diphosphatase
MKRTIKDYPNGARVQALVIRGDDVLVIHRNHFGEEYYVLPGGGWEDGETREEGAVREAFEETSLKVKIIRLVFSMYIKNDGQRFVYMCEYQGGEPTLGDSVEKIRMDQTAGKNFYEPMWFPISKLKDIILYDLQFRDWFIENYKNGKLPEEAKELYVD